MGEDVGLVRERGVDSAIKAWCSLFVNCTPVSGGKSRELAAFRRTVPQLLPTARHLWNEGTAEQSGRFRNVCCVEPGKGFQHQCSIPRSSGILGRCTVLCWRHDIDVDF
jgi:hypothetical protein